MTGVPVATAPAIIGLPRIISLMLFIFSIFGLWNPHSSRLYAIYSYTLHFTCTFLYTISLVAGVLTLNTTEELIAASSMTLTMVATCVLVGNMYVYNGQIRQLLRRISDFPLKDGDANERAIVQRCSSFFTMVASSLYVLANMAASSQNLAALLKGRLPFVAVFPAVDRFHSFWYLYQSGGMTMMSNVNITLQMFPDYLMYMCSAQFQLLDARLRALGRGCRAHPNFGVSVPEMPDQAAARRELIVCIRTHQEIIECVDAVQNLFGFSFFVQTTAMAAISGASAVQLTMVVVFCEFLHCVVFDSSLLSPEFTQKRSRRLYIFRVLRCSHHQRQQLAMFLRQ